MRFSLHQIQAIVEIARGDFHVSKAAERLHTSQSAISKHLKSFENSLSAKVFVRSGKRLTGLTPEGRKILRYAERMLHDHDCIEKIGQEARTTEQGTLSLATTPTVARYLLSDTVKAFTGGHPQVHLHIQVEESDKALDTVRLAQCDFAIVPIGRARTDGLTVRPLVNWTRLLIGLPDCPLFSEPELTLEKIASEPLIAFETPTVCLRETFDKHGLLPKIALTTSNPEVMKAYAALGLGVAVVAAPTFDPVRDAPLVGRDVSALIPGVTIGAVVKADGYHTALQGRFLDHLKANLPARP